MWSVDWWFDIGLMVDLFYCCYLGRLCGDQARPAPELFKEFLVWMAMSCYEGCDFSRLVEAGKVVVLKGIKTYAVLLAVLGQVVAGVGKNYAARVCGRCVLQG